MSNPLYDQMFNPQYVNPEYIRQMQVQHDREQRQEIGKAVKAMRDYLDAIGKIEPQYQQEAFAACAAVILEEMQRRHS